MAQGLLTAPTWAKLHDAFAPLSGTDRNMTGRWMDQQLAAQKWKQEQDDQQRQEQEREQFRKMAMGLLGIGGQDAPAQAPGAAVYNPAAPQGVPHMGAQPASVNQNPVGSSSGLLGHMPSQAGGTSSGLLYQMPPYMRLQALSAAQKGDVGTLGSVIGQYRESQREGQETDFDRSTKLRKEYFKETADPRSVIGSAKQVYQAALRGTGPSDVALLTSFMKVLDPGSVVRESEFMTAQKAQGLQDRMKSFIASIQEGERLTPKARREFAAVVKEIADVAAKEQKRYQDRYTKLAKGYNLNPERVVWDYTDLSDMDLDAIYTPSQEGADSIGSRSTPYEPQSQEDFDAIPSGAYFIDDEGLKVKE